MNRLFLIALLFSGSLSAWAQHDTIFVCEKSKNAVLLIFDHEFDGELGNQDYEVVPKGNTMKIAAKVKNTVSSFLQVNTTEDKKQYFFILAYRPVEKLKQIVYDFRASAMKPEPKTVAKGDEKIKFSTTVAKEEKKVSPVKIENDKGVKKEEPKTDLKGNALLDSLAIKARADKFSFGIYATKEGRMLFKLVNVFVHEDYFIFKLRIYNNSTVKYNLALFDIFLGSGTSLLVKNLPSKSRLTVLKTYPEFNQVFPIASGEDQEFVLITNVKIADGFKTLFFVINTDDQSRMMFVTFPMKELLKAKKLDP